MIVTLQEAGPWRGKVEEEGLRQHGDKHLKNNVKNAG